LRRNLPQNVFHPEIFDENYQTNLTIEEIFQFNSQPWDYIPFSDYLQKFGGMHFIRNHSDFAPGDFLLASREFWYALGEYLEGEMNARTDTIFDHQGFSLLPGFVVYFFNFTTLHINIMIKLILVEEF
jgi:hypothetical protein